jgi:hypothetical protein
MTHLLRRGRAWVSVARAGALFVLPLPLVVAVIASIVTGDVGRLALTGSALGCLTGAGVLCWRALVAEARYFLGERPDPPELPLKLAGAVATAAGAGLAALAGGHAVPGALVFAALGGLGARLFMGADLRPHPIRLAPAEGIDRDAVVLQLKQAYGRLRGIEASAALIAVPEFGERLGRITAIGHDILQQLERHPRDASRARRFLNLYLDSAERVTTEYARAHQHIRSQPLDTNFRQLLVDMEQTFDQQRRTLLERDARSLEVEIEVLNARLKREGAG